MDRLNQFKKKRYEFGSVEARIARACEIEKRRKQQRAKDIARNRFTTHDDKLSKVISLPKEIPSSNAPINNRVKQLLKWKAEKELKKKIEAQTKKPPFVVGIPHHNPWSALIDNSKVFDCQHHKRNEAKLIVSTRITRATAKQLAQKEQSVIKPDTLLNYKPKSISKEKKKCKDVPVATFPSIEHHVFHAPKGIAPVRILDVKSFSTDKNVKTSTDSIVKSSFVCGDNNASNQPSMNMKLDEGVNNMNKNENQINLLNQFHSDVKLFDDENRYHEIIQKKNLLHEKDINIPFQPSVPAALSPFVTTKRGKSNIRDEERERLGLNYQRNTTPTKNNITKIINTSVNESPKTAQYYKYLLNQETNQLHGLCESWKKIQENSETTDDGRYIINQAIGQTILLINKKFKRFDGLVSDCMKGNEELLITCRDLQGFWDMMSMEIKDCHSRFDKLKLLQANSWVEENPDMRKMIKPKRRPIKKNKINGKSNMRAFIEASRKQQINNQKVDLELDHIIISKNQSYSTKENSEQQVLIKIPEPKLDDSIPYINLHETPGKGILKYNSKIDKSYDELNKSTSKVNFNEVIIINNTLPKKIIDNNKIKICPSNNIITPTRILRSQTQFKHVNIVNNTSDNIENLKKRSSPFNKSNMESNRELVKENDYTSTPHQRRSTRKSIKLNYSGECTVCTSESRIKSNKFI